MEAALRAASMYLVSFMLSLVILILLLFFSLKGLTFLEGSFATMGVLEAPQGMLNMTSFMYVYSMFIIILT